MDTIKLNLYDAYQVLLAAQQSHINALISVLKNRISFNDSKELLEDILNKIIVEFQKLINSEEELMSVFLYDKLRIETDNNNQTLEKIKDYATKFKAGAVELSIDTISTEIQNKFQKNIQNIESITKHIANTLESTPDKFNDSDDLSVRVSIFDIQHRNIDFLFENIIYNLEKDADKNHTLELIDSLIEKFEIHFYLEEDLMQKHKYPELEEHKEDHSAFVKLMRVYREQYLNNELKTSAASLYEVLKIEVDEHIKTTDKRYTKFFNDRGIL